MSTKNRVTRKSLFSSLDMFGFHDIDKSALPSFARISSLATVTIIIIEFMMTGGCHHVILYSLHISLIMFYRRGQFSHFSHVIFHRVCLEFLQSLIYFLVYISTYYCYFYFHDELLASSHERAARITVLRSTIFICGILLSFKVIFILKQRTLTALAVQLD